MISGCGNCYGAASPTIPCCNTCNDVIQVYNEKTWGYDVRDFIQCNDNSH